MRNFIDIANIQKVLVRASAALILSASAARSQAGVKVLDPWAITLIIATLIEHST